MRVAGQAQLLRGHAGRSGHAPDRILARVVGHPDDQHRQVVGEDSAGELLRRGDDALGDLLGGTAGTGGQQLQQRLVTEQLAVGLRASVMPSV